MKLQKEWKSPVKHFVKTLQTMSSYLKTKMLRPLERVVMHVWLALIEFWF